jgi:glutathione S-transferase
MSDVKSRLLISIPASHYVERARFALDLAGASYVESGYLPIFHYASTRVFYQNARSVPILDETLHDGSHRVLKDSQLIVEHLCPSLYPAPILTQVREWETLFTETLGPHARRACYYMLFHPSNRALALNALAWKQPAIGMTQRLLASVNFRLLQFALLRSLNITPRTAKRSMEIVKGVFAKVAAQLETNGTEYLCGDSLSAADVTFASMAAILVLPSSYGAWLPRMEEIQFMRKELEELRATPAGQHALKVYARHRKQRTAVRSKM